MEVRSAVSIACRVQKNLRLRESLHVTTTKSIHLIAEASGCGWAQAKVGWRCEADIFDRLNNIHGLNLETGKDHV